MPTSILVKVLQGLIYERLSPVITALTLKSQSPLHNKTFYTQFKDEIDGLDTQIKNFQSTGDDSDDVDTIDGILNTVQTKSEALRTGAGKLAEEGRTMTCLADIIRHTKKLHPKLQEFELIDVEYKEESPTPEGIVYLHAANYLGRGIFDPQKPTIRKLKEDQLKLWLGNLRTWQTKKGELILKIDKCISILKVLDTENYNMSGYGAQLAKCMFGTPVGRFETEITLAMQKLEAMKKSTLEGYRQAAEHKEEEVEEVLDDEDERSSLTATN